MLTTPIVQGAYYERGDGAIGQAFPTRDPGVVYILEVRYCVANGLTDNRLDDVARKRLTRRVYLVPTDPAEVVAELRLWASRAVGDQAVGVSAAADLVAEKLIGGES
jgi:hypothetical protein